MDCARGESGVMTVFISYAREDNAFVKRLVRDLQAHHVPVWQDQQRIGGGESWPAALAKAIQSSTHMVLVMSEAANADESFVNKEVIFAQDHKVTIIPIRIEDCATSLLVANLNYIDFHTLGYDTGLQQLLAALPQESPAAEEDPADDESAGERHARFWEALQARASARLPLHEGYKPPQRNTFTAAANYPKVKYRYVLHHRNASVQLYISTGSKKGNKALFDALRARRAAIEAAFGEPLEWKRLNKQQSSRIQKTVLVTALQDEANWPAAQDALIAVMARFEATLRPHLAALQE